MNFLFKFNPYNYYEDFYNGYHYFLSNKLVNEFLTSLVLMRSDLSS